MATVFQPVIKTDLQLPAWNATGPVTPGPAGYQATYTANAPAAA